MVPNCGQARGRRASCASGDASVPSRGTTTAKGYGSTHQATRKRWAHQIALGGVDCARCGRPIAPTEPFDLDHSDDRSTYLGPSHARCNRRAGATKTNGADRYAVNRDHPAPFRSVTGIPTSRDW